MPKADATTRDSYMDTQMRSTGVSWNRTALASPKKEQNRMFTKTVTNFSQVRYDNNGGLNPQSPYKRGLSLEVTTDVIGHPKQWQRASNSTMRNAKPGLDLDID